MFECISLDYVIEKLTTDEIEKAFDNFYCKNDPDISDFLKNERKARLFEMKSKSRTYLIINSEQSNEFIEIIAFFTIAIQILKIPADYSNTQVRNLDGLYSRRGNDNISEIPAYLIGQIAKNDLYSKRIDGKEIVEQAISMINKAQKIVGGRVVYLECNDEFKLLKFYRDNGFKEFRKDLHDNRIQMIRML